jgi:hypothetical protein
VQLVDAPSDATVWVPVPAVNTNWQRSLSSETSTEATHTSIETDAKSGARFVVANFASGEASILGVVSRVQTMSRAVDWHAAGNSSDNETAASLRKWVLPTALVPTDGIVRKTALQITKGA